VTGYEIFRCVGAGCSSFSLLTSVAATSYKDTGLTAATAYGYRVRAVDAAANKGPFTADGSATTQAGPDTEAPSAPGALTVSAVSSSEVDLSWGAATDNVGVTGYEIFRCTGAGCSTLSLVTSVAGTSYKDTGLTVATTYRYQVRAVDAAANKGPFTDVGSASTPDTQAPTAPGTLTASAVSPSEIDLSWGAATDDVGVTGYEIFRCLGAACTDFTLLTSVGSTSHKDTGLTAGTAYTYEVRAVDAAANKGPFSTAASATTQAASDTQPPTAPGTLSASAAGATEIDLDWGPATDNVGVTGYDVFRCAGAGCSNYSLLTSIGTGTSYADTAATARTTYSYEVRAADAAGNKGPFSNADGATTPTGYVSVGPSGRYLVDQSGNPFMMTGDSPQAIIGNTSLADAESYFADRHAHGFNTVWVNLLCASYTGCDADGTTWDGVAPFTTPGDFSTPNEAYFERADQIIRLAEKYDLTVILDPAETGSWLDDMVSNGVQKDRDYGRYVGARYKDFPNIIWMSGNDYQDWGPTNDQYVTAVAQGIADEDSRHLQTIELNYYDSSSLDDAAWTSIIRLNATYTYSPTYKQLLKDYYRTSFLPNFMVEATYEFEQNAPFIPFGDPYALRRQEYWTMLSGATGQLYGNHYTWGFICSQRNAGGDCIGGWKDKLDTTGVAQLQHVTALFEPRAWYDLVPDGTHTTVTAGWGTFGDWDYVTAARTPNGKLALAYLPNGGTITVDMSQLSGPVTARWYDPASGAFTAIAGSPFPNSGSRDFTTPGNNSDGAGNPDWVLVLEAN
jgi:chitodextrinase